MKTTAGKIFLACLVAVAALAGAIAFSADDGAQKVEAKIDSECKSMPATFTVPTGKTAVDFKRAALEPGSACHEGGAPENQGFALRDAKNKPVYMWSQYKDQPPYEKGGPLSSLSLAAGEYTLSVAGGAGARVELTYRLK